MQLSQMLVQELALESQLTRHALERVPEDKFDWKPHPRSMDLGWLATFSAVLLGWGVDVIVSNAFDFKAPHDPPLKRKSAASSADLMHLFDQNVAALRTAIQGASDEHLEKAWTLQMGGVIVFTKPRWLVLRTQVLNHAVHHRGQLTVYLRLLGIPVPAIYNDSADEHGGMFVEPAFAHH